MFEKVNPAHPDKVADRIAGALVDMAYAIEREPKIAVEVLIGHGECNIIAETSVELDDMDVKYAVQRISGNRYINVRFRQFAQDPILNGNQKNRVRCGDNGIFRGVPINEEQKELGRISRMLYKQFRNDGKYIIDYSGEKKSLIICQSNAGETAIKCYLVDDYWNEPKRKVPNTVKINPLGYWTGGTDVDSGATNRKLGSDMGDAVTGGGLHGKDLSKADVSVNIYAHLKARKLGKPVELYCAIGDETVDGRPYQEIVDIARAYINEVGGFEKFAEWGLI